MEVLTHCGFTFNEGIKNFFSVNYEETFSEYKAMLLLKMITFCKNAKCPSSEHLLDFIGGELSARESEKVGKHLSGCEFCSSEMELYEHCPQTEEVVADVEIPLPLFQLAEALLGNRHKDFRLLNKLLSENESLSLNQA
jgi:hypothetical protein